MSSSYRLPSGYELNFDESRSISILNTPHDTYCAISEHQQTLLEDEIRDTYEEGENVLEQNRSWKYDASSILPIRHEQLYQDVLNIRTPIRGDVIGKPSEEEKEVASLLHDISHELLSYRYENQVTLYRGVGYEGPYLLESIFNQPNQSEHIPPDERLSALSNYTCSLRGAAGFYRLVVKQNSVPVSDIALASNYLFIYGEGPDVNMYNEQGLYSPNGEVRVRGDSEYPVDEENLLVVVSDPGYNESIDVLPIREFAQGARDFSDDEHAIMETFVDDMGNRDIKITNEESISFLEEWEEEFVSVYQQEPIERIETLKS